MPAETKTRKVERLLRDRVMGGHWQPGERLPREQKLLREFGVSRMTLLQALSSLVSDDLIVRTRKAGTFVAPRAMKTGMVAMAVDDYHLSSPVGYYYQKLVSLAERKIEEAGYRAVLAAGRGTSDEAFVSSLTCMDEAAHGNLLGVLDMSDRHAFLARLAKKGVPSVSISPVIPANAHCVVLDYHALMRLAVRELEAHGIHDFALVTTSCVESAGSPGSFTAQVDAEENRMAESAVRYREDRLVRVPGSPDLYDTYRLFKDWWASPDRPHAVFFYDDALCDVATRAMLELGIRVPKDLSVITQANVGRRFHFPVPFTRVEWDPAEVVDAAWGLLRKLLAREVVEEPVIRVAPKLHRGKSLAQLAKGR